jgi:hypothetical protein
MAVARELVIIRPIFKQNIIQLPIPLPIPHIPGATRIPYSIILSIGKFLVPPPDISGLEMRDGFNLDLSTNETFRTNVLCRAYF